ncbi:hypothetical protein GCM10008986_11590 [Salinibacillus aidingensis]|uniref:Uncharacterized protein n=1 Tax=Salinibacillus aidingensis TaxID=237684 RepID=A0ABP3KV75_9BACI
MTAWAWEPELDNRKAEAPAYIRLDLGDGTGQIKIPCQHSPLTGDTIFY